MSDIIWTPSPNFNDRAHPISMLVLHYTGMQNGPEAIARMTDADAGVSAHYCIDEDGTVVQMVHEDHRAWHAGVSRWRGMEDINSRSIGIEIVNPGHEFGYRPFTEAQMEALLPLVAEIVQTHSIEPRNVVGHSDIAPARKEDPGELFDWHALASRGLATARPEKAHMDPGWSDAAFLLAMERYGYCVDEGRAATRAFQRRFRQELVDGEIDGQCRAILMRLLLECEG